MLLVLMSCKDKHKPDSMHSKQYDFDLQGHRGARGLYPENTLQAFQKAIDIGVNTLELDVVISKDSLVVVSHEAFMNPKICKTPDGDIVKDSLSYNLYEMAYDDIKAFDCGSMKHTDFPEQKPIKSYKPLLSEVLDLITKTAKSNEHIPALNIEIKSNAETDDIYHPKPRAFVELVVDELKRENIPENKIILQSFDKRVVRYTLKKYPEFKTAYLTYEGNLSENLKGLGEIPHIYSPLYHIVDSSQIQMAHNKGIKVIPWTINTTEDLQKMLELGVDGIITDYPNRAKLFQKP